MESTPGGVTVSSTEVDGGARPEHECAARPGSRWPPPSYSPRVDPARPRWRRRRRHRPRARARHRPPRRRRPSTPSEAVTPTPTPAPDAVLLAAGDIAACSQDGDSATAAILARYPDATVQTLGDNAYDKGTPRQFGCYDDTWGVALDRTHPALGGHDYMTGGSRLLRLLRGVLAPFAPDGHRPDDGLVRLRPRRTGGSSCSTRSAMESAAATRRRQQLAWLTRRSWPTHPARCSLAVIHNPRFSSGRKENEPRVQPLWEALHAAGRRAGPQRRQPRLRTARADDARPASGRRGRHPPVRRRDRRPQPLQFSEAPSTRTPRPATTTHSGS